MAEVTRQRASRVVICLLALAGIVGAAPSSQGGAFRLDNGLWVIHAYRPGQELLAVHLTVGYGAADDPKGSSGLAHLLEHASLTGTLDVGSLEPTAELAALANLDRVVAVSEGAGSAQHHQALEEALRAAANLREAGEPYASRLEMVGAVGLNAATWQDRTEFFTRLPRTQLGRWLELEADRIAHPLFRDFYREQQIVAREINGAWSGRQPHDVVASVLGYPPLRPVSGVVEEVLSIGRPQALAAFSRAYRPGNMTLAVVGDLDRATLTRLVEGTLGQVVAGPSLPPCGVDTVRSTPAAFVLPVRAVNKDPFVLAFRLPQAGSVEAAALEVVAQLFENDRFSPLLTSAAVDQPRMTVGTTIRRDCGRSALLALEVVVSPQTDGEHEVSPGFVAQALALALDRFDEFGQDALEGALSRTRIHHALIYDDPSQLAAALALSQVRDGDWRLADTRRKRLAELSTTDLRRAAQRWLAGPLRAALSAGKEPGE